jgi:hypothetical protein
MMKTGNKAFLVWLSVMVPLVIALTVIGYQQTEYVILR